MKLKVAMICCYSNQMIRSHLHLSSLALTNFIHNTVIKRSFFLYSDDGLWNANIIENVVERDEWELHVISSHLGMKNKTEEFEKDGVGYHYFKGELLFPYNKVDKILHPTEYVTYDRNRKYVKGFLNAINPDFVILVGAENPRYSITALDVKDKPVFILCQTVVVNNGKGCPNARYANILSIEKQLLGKTPYVAVYCLKHYQQLLDAGYDGNIFEFQWPPINKPKPKVVYEGPKEYDFINFAARATDDKGYKDSLGALAIVKRKYPNVRLNLKVDPGKQKEELLSLVEKLGLRDNVSFTASFENTDDLLRHIQKSRFAVLPCKLDNTSGTMTQCMTYNIPIVVYKTLGTLAYNDEKPCALVAEMNNVDDLAEKMLFLLDNPEEAATISKNAEEYIEKRKVKRQNAMPRLVADVNAIIDNYYNGTPIPQELLFNPAIDK